MFPYQSNSQNFFKFYCHFLGRRERGVFPVPLAFAKKFLSFADWLKNGGVLRGSGRGGLRVGGVGFCDNKGFSSGFIFKFWGEGF